LAFHNANLMPRTAFRQSLACVGVFDQVDPQYSHWLVLDLAINLTPVHYEDLFVSTGAQPCQGTMKTCGTWPFNAEPNKKYLW
jgi:hypothetical protein